MLSSRGFCLRGPLHNCQRECHDLRLQILRRPSCPCPSHGRCNGYCASPRWPRFPIRTAAAPIRPHNKLPAACPLPCTWPPSKIISALWIFSTSLRRGPDGDPNSPNAANYDESKVTPPQNLPDVLNLNNGKPVTSAKMWWDQRRPEIVEDFGREILGRRSEKHSQIDILPGLKSGDSYGLHAYAWMPSVVSCHDALTACEGCEQGPKAHGRNHS